MITEGSIRPQVKGLLLRKKKQIKRTLRLIAKLKILENKEEIIYNEVSYVFNYPLPANKQIPNHSKPHQDTFLF